MIVVIDANIVFSALVTSNPNRRKYLFSNEIKLYSPNFLITEIFKHKEPILKASTLSNSELSELLNKVFQRISFVNEELISVKNYMEVYRLCKGIDENDVPFLALTLQLDGKLWTKDKQLKTGLLARGFNSFFKE